MKKNIIKLTLFLLTLSTFFYTVPVFAAKKVDDNFTCSVPEVYRAMGMVGRILLLMKILIPIVIVVIASIHFGKSVISQDDSDIKQLFMDLLKKVMIGVIVFFTPTIIIAIADAALSKRADNVQWSLCVEALKTGKLEQTK